ncbi:MAG: hypothetical protein GXY88_00840, partial [Tissierellia bacterium]|nr:hypothetical protein [Tissierellia bacterium]
MVKMEAKGIKGRRTSEPIMNTKDKIKVKSLGRRVVATTSIFLILVVTISTYFSVQNAREALYKQLDEQADQIAHILLFNLKNLSQVERDVDRIIDTYIENLGHFIKVKGSYTNEELKAIERETGVSEINIVNHEGVIVYSNLDGNLDYIYPEGHPVRDIVEGEIDKVVEDIRQSTLEDTYYKYGAVKADFGAVQIGIKADHIVN